LALFRRAYGLDQPPNFEGRAWHLQRLVTTRVLSESLSLTETEVEAVLASARRTLLERRARRVRPTIDVKQLTSWNALLAGGFVRAARALQCDEWLDRAVEIFRFIRRDLWRDGGLLAVYNGGESRFPAYLDDHAWLLGALLDYLAARWEPGWLEWAIELADALLGEFEEAAGGGFYFSGASVEVPITRSMTFQDDATPSGNGIAILALNRLGRLLGEPRYTTAAERALRRALPQVQDSPLAHGTLLRALHDAVYPPAKLVISGTDPDAQSRLKQWAEGRHRLDCYLVGPAVDGLPGILREFRTDQPATAWLCRGMQCLPPVHSADGLDDLMSDTGE
jgi:hypothetical protein